MFSAGGTSGQPWFTRKEYLRTHRTLLLMLFIHVWLAKPSLQTHLNELICEVLDMPIEKPVPVSTFSQSKPEDAIS